jgi:hypothetical protein
MSGRLSNVSAERLSGGLSGPSVSPSQRESERVRSVGQTFSPANAFRGAEPPSTGTQPPHSAIGRPELPVIEPSEDRERPPRHVRICHCQVNQPYTRYGIGGATIYTYLVVSSSFFISSSGVFPAEEALFSVVGNRHGVDSTHFIHVLSPGARYCATEKRGHGDGGKNLCGRSSRFLRVPASPRQSFSPAAWRSAGANGGIDLTIQARRAKMSDARKWSCLSYE